MKKDKKLLNSKGWKATTHKNYIKKYGFVKGISAESVAENDPTRHSDPQNAWMRHLYIDDGLKDRRNRN